GIFSVGENAGGARSTVVVDRQEIIADGADTATVVVTVRDAGGAPSRGRVVALAAAPAAIGRFTISDPVATNANGEATFTVKGTLSGAYTLTATVDARTSFAAP